MQRVTAADLDVIYDGRKQKYRGVFRVNGKWMAQPVGPEGDKYLGLFPGELQAAQAVVRHYKYEYGWGWRDVVRRRAWHVMPFRVRRLGAAYTCDVWVNGGAVRVTARLVTDRTGSEGGAWLTRADAVRAMREFKELVRPAILCA